MVLPAAFQKETPPCWDGVIFWSGRRGSLAAQPGRHTHAGTKTCPRHVSLASLVPCSCLCPVGKCKKTPPCRMVFLFGAGDEARWRPSRAATRTRAPKHAPGMFLSLRSCPVRASARPINAKKKTPPCRMVLFWSGRRGSNSLPRPWQGRALPDELRPQNNGYYSA